MTASADQECRRLARQVKRRHPAGRVVVTGCYAQTQPAAAAAVADIDAVIGNTAKDRVGDWLPRVLAAPAGEPLVLVDDFAPRPRLEAPQLREFAGHSRAFVKVQDGCDLRCAYCLIWQARGPARSRPAADVVAQLAALHHDARLPRGRALGRAPRRVGPRPRWRAACPDLLAAVTDALPDLRVRLGSLHPDELTPDLLRLLAQNARGCGRTCTSRCRAAATPSWPACAGPTGGTPPPPPSAPPPAPCRGAASAPTSSPAFPGRPTPTSTPRAIWCESLPFTYLHVFRFSPRPGTPAADLPEPVSPDVVTAAVRPAESARPPQAAGLPAGPGGAAARGDHGARRGRRGAGPPHRDHRQLRHRAGAGRDRAGPAGDGHARGPPRRAGSGRTTFANFRRRLLERQADTGLAANAATRATARRRSSSRPTAAR